MENRPPRSVGCRSQAAPTKDDGQSGDVCGGDRERDYYCSTVQGWRRFQIQPADHALALVHGSIRKHC